MPMAITAITMKAPMSGSASNNEPTTATAVRPWAARRGRSALSRPSCAPCSLPRTAARRSLASSDGWKPMNPMRDPASRAVDDLAYPGDQHRQSTTPSETTNNQGALRSHRASPAPERPATPTIKAKHTGTSCGASESAWANCSCAKRGLSGNATEAEYTMTSPQASNASTTRTRLGESPARSRGGDRLAGCPPTRTGSTSHQSDRSAERPLELLRTPGCAMGCCSCHALQISARCVGQGVHRLGEHTSPVRVVVEHVKAGAGGRHQHGVTRPRQLGR
jgi:hypothetical protein